MIVGERWAFRAARFAVVGVLLPAHGVDSALRTSKRSRWGRGTGRGCRPEARPWHRKPSGASAWRRRGGQWVAEASAREAASEGSIWRFLVEMAPTVEMQPPRDTYSQVTSLTPPLLHGHTIGGFSSQGSAARRQTRPVMCGPGAPRQPQQRPLEANVGCLRAESATVRRSLEMRSRL